MKYGIIELHDLYDFNAPNAHREVVMCKECKYKYQEPWHNGVRVEGECEIWQRATLADDFCSYAERSK